MKVELQSSFPITDDACRAETGRTFAEWFDFIEGKGPSAGRRAMVAAMYEEIGKKSDFWWPTTVWVEYEKSRGVVQKDGRPEGYNICSTKTIAKPVAEVFAWFAPEKLEQWLCGGIKLAADGAFTTCQGSTASTTRIRENKDIRWAWQSAGLETPSEVEVKFAETAGKTGIVLNHNRIQTREEADGLRAAWAAVLGDLKKLAEG